MIIKNNEEALRIKCEDVSLNEVGELIDLLDRELINSARLGSVGIGLAAPQCGIAKKIAIVRIQNIKINLVNAKIIQTYDPSTFYDEGCLSFPGRVENTLRFQEITVTDNLVYPYNFIATGLTAVVIQHELDHLNNILFMDHKIITPSFKKNKIGPNDLCPCGKIDILSGKVKKYKKCCK